MSCNKQYWWKKQYLSQEAASALGVPWMLWTMVSDYVHASEIRRVQTALKADKRVMSALFVPTYGPQRVMEYV